MFGVQMGQAFGTFGEFAVGQQDKVVRAKYLLTKIRPGSDGHWECELASQMVPWREVFNLEELDFDELLQRDLDDSRVAHDLIPYLLGESGANARFFPPILAIIVPRRTSGPGIEPLYPAPSAEGKYGKLFEFEQVHWESEPTPLGALRYNRQRCAFVIADGQHRAMAILALHRQITDGWGSNVFASYYSHLQIAPQQVANLALPVCLIHFPDLYEGNPHRRPGVDLKTVCRELFVVVNKTAKPVNPSRELLLDDEDIAACLMRRTLSHFKNRALSNQRTAIYSVAYGDSDAESGQQVVKGVFQTASAVSLHRVHAALSFGRPDGFRLSSPADVSDMRNARNGNTPAEILLGTEVEHLATIARRSGRVLPPEDVAVIVKKLSQINDTILLGLFDNFRVFTVHNEEMFDLRTRLSDPVARGDLIQSKCYNLLFEGSGVRGVFDDHLDRLRGLKDDLERGGAAVPQHVSKQLEYCDSVVNAISRHDVDFQRRRACRLANVSFDAFYEPSQNNADDRKQLEEWSRRVYSTVSTQAFQLGISMVIATVVRRIGADALAFQQRLGLTSCVTKAYVAALNRFFSPDDAVLHRTLNGLPKTSRTQLFDTRNPGLRGLLAMSVNELNERKWDFFSYLTLEVVHSTLAAPVLATHLGNDRLLVKHYHDFIPDIVQAIHASRAKLSEDAVESAVKSQEFRLYLLQEEARARGAGSSEPEIEEKKSSLTQAKRSVIEESAKAHIKATLGIVETTQAMTNRLQRTLQEVLDSGPAIRPKAAPGHEEGVRTPEPESKT